uniref:Uncharacterized protein n=1 Tax=Neogobius melanostomus TaxID=47308 RepID=A0A8C6U8Q9_9GOBI
SFCFHFTVVCYLCACTDLSGADLKKIFNSPVYKAEWMVRPLRSLPVVIGPISHTGVRVTLCDGSQWLIHKGHNYGTVSDTVVTTAKNMSNKWTVREDFEGKKTVSDFVKAGGGSYTLFFNCHVVKYHFRMLNCGII